MERDRSFYSSTLFRTDDSFISSIVYQMFLTSAVLLFTAASSMGGIENLRQLMACLCDKSFADKTAGN